MVLAYDFYKSFWILNPNLTKEYFLIKVGARDGYAKNMFSRIYDCIFSELIDVEEEYEKYYSFEYESFAYYLYKKYNLKVEDIEELIHQINTFPNCRIYRKDDHSYGDYKVPQFITSEIMYDRIIKILTHTI
ncbi:hypothetical protein [Myroides odoratimimus]|uniref:hypothetical protein n=1 Tax=Myroides odoratimimus TaxID=76832 RepID=UPI002DBA06AE|nr:hypothetical protein [Myroides odoratimimus]MEC4086234.1 hypothetical protein [Myroides odoratimimus]